MTPSYMLDADTVSYLIRGYGQVGETLQRHRPSAICISSITLAELRFGAARRKSVKLAGQIDTFVSNVTVVVFDEACAAQFGLVASILAELGSPIGQFDALIAAHALALDLTLVTNNIKHFSRVAGLKFENWV